MPPGHILKDQLDRKRIGSGGLMPDERGAGSVPSTIAQGVSMESGNLSSPYVLCDMS